MNEKILVFRGELVRYNTATQSITCYSNDDCFKIENVPLNNVEGKKVTVYSLDGEKIYIEGTELWTNGTKYIIKYNPPTDKNQTKPPKTTNQSLENLSTYVDEAVAKS